MLADITISTEAAVAIGVMFTALSGAVAWGVQGWISTLKSDRDSWMGMALGATDDMEIMANRVRKAKGKPAFKRIASVIAESSSPPTEQQTKTADIATVRALQAALRDDLDLPPRKAEPLAQLLSQSKGQVVKEMADKMKAGVDKSADEIKVQVEHLKEQVDVSAEQVKNKIDDIK